MKVPTTDLNGVAVAAVVIVVEPTEVVTLSANIIRQVRYN